MKNILIIGNLTNNKFVSKTQSLVDMNLIKNVYLFRSNGNAYINNKKVKIAPLLNPFSYNRNKVYRLIFDLYNLGYFFYCLLMKKIDIIIGIYLYPHGYYASLLGKIFSKPVILILPGTDLEMLIEKQKHIKLFQNTNFIGLRGNNSKLKIQNIGFDKNKLFILPNIFEIEKYNYTTTTTNYDIVVFGILKPGKRIEFILEVIMDLKINRPNIKCLILGDGEEKQNLVNYSKNLKLNNNVIFKDYHENFINDLLKSKIFILASYREGLPMTIIEAMSCAIPVVVSNINDIPDVVNHEENGYLVHYQDLDKFSYYCNKLLVDEKLRLEMGKNARRTIEKLYKCEYSPQAVYNIWESIINKCI